MSADQHKPVVAAHDYAFDEDGQPVSVYHQPEAPLECQLLQTLRELDLAKDQDKALAQIGAMIDAEAERRASEQADQKAAELLARIVSRLGIDSPEGVALRIAICGLDKWDFSYRVAAKSAGVSHVALWKRVKRICAKLRVNSGQ